MVLSTILWKTLKLGNGTKTDESTKKFKRGEGVTLQSKNLYCRCWTFTQGFKEGFSEKVNNMIFQK